MSTVYEEQFPNGIGKVSEELYVTAKSLCAVAQEIREYRLYRQKRDQQMDEARAAFDEQEEARLAAEAENRKAQADNIMKNVTDAFGQLSGFMPPAPPGFTLPAIGYASTLCKCGHLHDKDGCIVCDCKEPQKTMGKTS